LINPPVAVSRFPVLVSRSRLTPIPDHPTGNLRPRQLDQRAFSFLV